MLVSNYIDEADLDKKAIREGFGKGVVLAKEENPEVVVLNADLPGSLKLGEFEEKFPESMVQVGVAEQNMAGIATGLERVGKIPFITSFAAFSPGLNYSQIRLACMGKQNIKIVGSHYGLNIGEDGASAQMNADIAMMKALPNMTILNPADYNQAIEMTKLAVEIEGPVYLRVTRAKFPVFLENQEKANFARAHVLKEGSDITVLVSGSMVYETLQAVNTVEQSEGVSVEVVNLHTVKPLDETTIIESVEKTGKCIVIEEHNYWGGIGESVARILLENEIRTKFGRVAVEDTFGESGSHADLWKKYGLSRDKIAEKIKTLL